MRSRCLLASIALAVVLVSCGSDGLDGPRHRVGRQSDDASPALGQPFTLGVGESATLDGTGVRLTFVTVTEDSRCPPMAMCVWAGDAATALVLSAVGQSALADTLHTNGSPSFRQSTVFAGIRVTLLDVSPRQSSEYRARFVAEK